MDSDNITIPNNYYISIRRMGPTSKDNYRIGSNGECFITLYNSLDVGHARPLVEHVIAVGSFKLNTKDKKVDEFFREIREGIEKLISPEKR